MVTRRARRWLARGLTVAAAAAVIFLLIASWLQAGTVARDWLDVHHRAVLGPVRVVSVGVEEVVLRDEDGARAPGTWGLVFDGGRAVVGEVVSVGGGEVRRLLDDVSGALVPGTEVAFDSAVWGEGAAERLGFSEVEISGPDEGSLRAWTAPGDDDTWVVFVHGNGADMTQGLRAAGIASRLGYPTMIVSYRNDDGDPPSESGRHGFGYDEWRDVEAALHYALGSSALDFVVVGFGSGGSIAGVLLYESSLADRVLGVILDAPVLSLDSAIADSWARTGVPGWAIDWTKAIASMRFGVDLDAIDHVERADEWEPPVLIIHDRQAASDSLAQSEAFAIAKGGDALLVTFPGALPGASWNSDPERYEDVMTRFLDRVGAGTSTFEPVDP